MAHTYTNILIHALFSTKVKANSSGWVKNRWPKRRSFGWQTGYAAFSVSKSHVEQVKRYLGNQEEHHRKVSFQEEVVAFLKKQGVEYDPRYVFVQRNS